MNKFGDYTAHGDTYIGETLDQLLNGHCNVQSIPKISCTKERQVVYIRQSSFVGVPKSRGNWISETD